MFFFFLSRVNYQLFLYGGNYLEKLDNYGEMLKAQDDIHCCTLIFVHMVK